MEYNKGVVLKLLKASKPESVHSEFIKFISFHPRSCLDLYSWTALCIGKKNQSDQNIKALRCLQKYCSEENKVPFRNCEIMGFETTRVSLSVHTSLAKGWGEEGGRGSGLGWVGWGGERGVVRIK